MWLFNDEEMALCYISLLSEETSMFVQVKKKCIRGLRNTCNIYIHSAIHFYAVPSNNF